MKETLNCSSCGKNWKRDRVRGRKPIFCPKCVANNTEPPKEIIQNITKPVEKVEHKVQDTEKDSLLHDVYKFFYPKVTDDQLKNQKSGSKWQCPSCNYLLTLYIPISDIPYHKCTPSSTTGRELKRIS